MGINFESPDELQEIFTVYHRFCGDILVPEKGALGGQCVHVGEFIGQAAPGVGKEVHKEAQAVGPGEIDGVKRQDGFEQFVRNGT